MTPNATIAYRICELTNQHYQGVVGISAHRPNQDGGYDIWARPLGNRANPLRLYLHITDDVLPAGLRLSYEGATALKQKHLVIDQGGVTWGQRRMSFKTFLSRAYAPWISK